MRRNTLDDIHRRIGRNLVRFQEIEFALKFCLPYIHPKGSKLGVEAMREFQVAVRKQMLGQLIGAFKESTEGADEALAEELRKLVDARNQLMHHLFELPGVDLLSDAGADELNRYLDDQFQAAAEWHSATRRLAMTLLEKLRDADAALFAQLENQYPGMTEKLRRAFDSARQSS